MKSGEKREELGGGSRLPIVVKTPRCVTKHDLPVKSDQAMGSELEVLL